MCSPISKPKTSMKRSKLELLRSLITSNVGGLLLATVPHTERVDSNEKKMLLPSKLSDS